MVRTGVMLCLLVMCGWLQASPVQVGIEPRMALDDAVRYLEDADGSLTIDAVRQGNQPWQPNGNSAFNKGYNDSVWWLHLQLINNTDVTLLRYVELSYAVLDQVDVHVFDSSKPVLYHPLGDLRPFAERPVENRFFVVPLTLQPGELLDLYYRIDTESAVQAPLTLWQRDAFESQENRVNIAQGFYYGAMVVIAVYNLLIFMVLWDRSYLYYVCFVLSVPLFMASLSGQAYRFLWPKAVDWNDHAIPVFLGGAFLFSFLFIRRFLKVREWSRWADNVLILVATIAGSCMLLAPALPYSVTIHILVPMGLFACIFAMAVGFMALYKGVPTARYYVIAWLSFLMGSVLLALNKINLIPNNFFTEYSIQIGSLLEAVLLSFAMAERMNQERRLRFEAQDEALRTTRRLNEELEARVQERTRELESLNEKLRDLSNTDQLTGLKNRRYLEQALEKEWTRCRRYQRPLAFIMMDVDHFKPVNDTYGHQAGDACLQQVAALALGGLRWPSDLVARYGGEEFCILLPETDAEGARVVAERVREAVEAASIVADGHSLHITISLGVYAAVPSEQESMHVILKNADQALYQAKDAGRNRVVVLGTRRSAAEVVPLPKRPQESGN